MSNFVIADRVKETTTSINTGDIVLTGASAGFQTFASVMQVGDTCGYCIDGGAEWEVGIGTLTSSTTLVRTTIQSSSNQGQIVTFSAGTKSVFLTMPAASLTANHAEAVAASAQAQASQSAAATSEANAATSASNAATSASAASTSASAAATSATNLANAVTAASTSAANALTSETDAKTSETNAKSSETNAATSASTATSASQAASDSKTAAATSASNAASSASDASSSASSALDSKNAAAASASAASDSAAAAQASAAAAVANPHVNADWGVTDPSSKAFIFNKPTIPTQTSNLTNNSGFITAAGAPVQSVAGKTGAVTLGKADVGLANVENTSDLGKPISTATQTALDGKMAASATTDSVTEGTNNKYFTAARARTTALTGLSTATSTAVVATDDIVTGVGKLQAQVSNKQDASAKDASGGYAGLTAYKINFKNAANTFTSFLTNANTAARTYTFPDKDITVAGTADITSALSSYATIANPSTTGTFSHAGAAIFGTTANDSGDRTFDFRNLTTNPSYGAVITLTTKNKAGTGNAALALAKNQGGAAFFYNEETDTSSATYWEFGVGANKNFQLKPLGVTQFYGAVNGVTAAQSDNSTKLATTEFVKAALTSEAVIAPTLLNGWTNYDTANYQAVGYYKDALGIVHLRGLVSNGLLKSPMFTLPVGYRPTGTELFTVDSDAPDGGYGGLASRVDVNPNGNVTVIIGTNTYVSLAGITFRAGS